MCIYQVIWMDELDNVLFYNDLRIIDDPRFMMERAGSTWNLRIREVRSRDGGKYRCMANTDPMVIKFFDLTVFGEQIIRFLDYHVNSVDSAYIPVNSPYIPVDPPGFPRRPPPPLL